MTTQSAAQRASTLSAHISSELYSTELSGHESNDSEDKPKVLLIVPDDRYLKSESSASFEEIIASDSDFKNNTLPQLDILEWKEKAIQSGSFEIKHYIDLAKQIHRKYLDYDGFVILDAITTIPYTANYLSFMFENLAKPVVLTGSHSDSLHQIFSDAKPNLLHSLTLAGYTNICEVMVCFNKKIYRGNRIQRNDVNHDPFITYNYPQLGRFAVTNLELTRHAMRHTVKRRFKTYTNLFTNIIVIHLIPQLTDETLKLLLFSQLTKRRKAKSKLSSTSLNSPATPSISTPTNNDKHNDIDKSSSKEMSLSFFSLPSPVTNTATTASFEQQPSFRKTKSTPIEQQGQQCQTSFAGLSEERKEFQSPPDSQKPMLRKSESFHAENTAQRQQQIARLNSVQSIRVRGNGKSKKSKLMVKGVVFSFFGVGNAPARESFKDVLKTAITEYECEIVVTCQSMMGGVDSSMYAAGDFLSDLNLISAGDMTIECCVAKLAYLMGKGYRGRHLKEEFETNLRGELTERQEKKRRVVQHIPMEHFMEADDSDSEEDETLETSEQHENHND